jgi:L-ascorbate metabolism protein UlaG (beta-lactamase superfamily)
MKVDITYIDTACLLININGFRIITDPSLDSKSGFFPRLTSKPFIFSKKTIEPANSKILQNNIDLALVSHDQHGDNLDDKGKELLKHVSCTLSTRGAEKRLKNLKIIGLKPWETYPIEHDLLEGLKITAVPAQHTNIKRLHYAVGHVIGFVIEWKGQENGALYISGDTVLFEGIDEIAKRFKIHTAILHLGAGAFPYLNSKLRLTMNAAEAIEVTNILKCKQVIPIHYEGWWHFMEPIEKMKSELNKAMMKDQLIWLERGVNKTITMC